MIQKQYTIGAAVGRGAVGVVYEAKPNATNRSVALKIMHAPVTRTAAYRNLFLREVQSLAKLHHRSIVEIFDFGETELGFELANGGFIPPRAPFLVMEFVEGKDLNQYVGSMLWDAVKHLTLELLDALAHAHARDVLHRDLKPENVILTERPSGKFTIKLVDFGLARPPAGTRLRRNSKLRIEGTPAYMAPELVRGDVRSQGPWTDLYALGCLLWEVTTGDIVFPDVEGIELLKAHTDQTPPEYDPIIDVPAGFEPWLRILLGKARFDRFEYAADAQRAFREFLRRVSRHSEF